MIRKLLSITFALYITGSSVAAIAAPAGLNEGIRAYNARQYRQAAGYLSQAAAAAPRDPMIHYYLGLSYQGMNQMTLARQEYNYVASCRTNPQLAAQASQALSNLSRYSTSYSGGGSYSSPVQGGSQIAASSPTVALNGRLKILYFHTDW